MTSIYREDDGTAHHPLAIETIWRFFAARETRHRVLPDGRCDIILRYPSDGRKPTGPIAVRIAGPSTRFHIVPIQAGTGFIGARLRPGMARGVLGLDPTSIVDRVLLDEEALEMIPSLAALCLPVRDDEALVERLRAFVVQRVEGLRTDPLTTALIDVLHLTGGHLSIQGVAQMHGVDIRTVRRRVTAATGLPPKQLAAVLRLHRALRLLRSGLGAAAVANEAGYADQAHMSRTFRRMGGLGARRPPQDLVLAGFSL